MHSPVDATVSVDQATRIFAAAKHPKSFVSLDNADHLLTRIEDAQYVANTITAWADRYLDRAEQDRLKRTSRRRSSRQRRQPEVSARSHQR